MASTVQAAQRIETIDRIFTCRYFALVRDATSDRDRPRKPR
ncbi:hypothetical protein [Phormidium nigroviride]